MEEEENTEEWEEEPSSTPNIVERKPEQEFEEITLDGDDDGPFEENWEFAIEETPLLPNEMLSCQESFEKIEWGEPREVSVPVFQMAVGGKKN